MYTRMYILSTPNLVWRIKEKESCTTFKKEAKRLKINSIKGEI